MNKLVLNTALSEIGEMSFTKKSYLGIGIIMTNSVFPISFTKT